MTTNISTILTGLRITYTGDQCNGAGKGIIVNAYPPDAYGQGDVDIILDDGRAIRRFPIMALRPIEERQGCGHCILFHAGHYADEREIASLIGKNALCEASIRAQELRKQELLALERAQVAKDFPFLTPTGGKYCGAATTAKNVRAALKHYFPGIKFSVKTSRGAGCNAIYVRWTDGPEVKAVDEICGMFELGSFDGMTDCYNYETSAFTDVFGGVRYVMTTRDRSDE